MRILLADDDDQLQRALRITLTARGYEVVSARDGAEAIDLAANGHPDLILLDLGMPEVDGVERVDLLGGVGTAREDDDRHVRPGAHRPDHVDAVDLGHAEVEQDEVGMPVRREVDGLRAVVGRDHLVAARGERDAQGALQLVVVLSGRADSSEKVDALDAGADDYVTKPFAMDELLARIRARARAVSGEVTDAATVRVGDLTVDLAAKTIRGDADGAASVRLTPTEWRLLELFLKNPGRLLTRQMLLGEVWGPFHANDAGYLRLYVAQLRRKLEPVPSEPRHFITEAGMGYRFEP